MIVNLILQAVFILILMSFWVGCGAFWARYIIDNNGVPLTKIATFTIYIVSPILFLFLVGYSIPFKILNWIADLKKEV